MREPSGIRDAVLGVLVDPLEDLLGHVWRDNGVTSSDSAAVSAHGVPVKRR